jgi:hypothetical protein
MAMLIDVQGNVRTIYGDDGRLFQVDMSERKLRLSRETWPDIESAKNAFSGHSIAWNEWMDQP